MSRFWVAIYRVWALSLPADVRASHGDEMVDAFARMLDDRRGRSPLERGRFAIRACFEVALEGAAERGRRLRAAARRLPGVSSGPRGSRMGTRGRGDGADGPPVLVRGTGGGGEMLHDFTEDLRHAVRGLGRTPVATLTLVLTLALGIGANSAVFSVLDAVLFAPLPYEDPDELYTVTHELTEIEGVGSVGVASPDLLDYIAGVPSFESMGSVFTLETNLTDEQGAARVTIGWVTPDLFPTLGTQAAVGRMLDPSDWTPRTRAQMEDPNFQPPPMPVMLAHGIWRSRFASDPEVVGRSLVINGTSMNVVGVLPEDFRILMPPEAGVPSRIDAFSYLPIPMTEGQRAGAGGVAIGRLADGATFERALDELRAVNRELHAVWPEHARFGTRVLAAPLMEGVVGSSRSLLWLLFGAIALVLVVAVANVASLLLVRAHARRREFAVRSALGVTRGRVVRKLLTEGLVVGVLGAAAGLALAVAGVDALVALAPVEIPRLDSVGVNGSVLGFTALVTLAAVLVFGAAPAVMGARVEGSSLVSGRGLVGSGRGGLRLRNALIVAEIALSVVLLAGAGLLLRSFGELSRVDPGYEPSGALAVEMALPFFTYRELEARQRFFTELRRRAAEIPGVEVAGLSPGLPLVDGGGSWTAPFSVDGPIGADTDTRARYRTASEGYVEALGARVVAGRSFDPLDMAEAGRQGAEVPVMVDRRFAEAVWPGESAIDRTLEVSVASYIGGGRQTTGRVVGVIEPIRHAALTAPDEPTVWVPFDEYAPLEGVLVLRGGFDPSAAVEEVRSILRTLDSGIPVYDVRPLADDLRRATAEQRYALLLMMVFAATAIALAAVGLYGVVSTSVQLRTREIGLRLAVGAEAREIGRMVLFQGARLTAVGVGIGLAATWFAAPALESLLFGVAPGDPATLLSTAALLAAVALVAGWLPARRASRMDPTTALRTES